MTDNPPRQPPNVSPWPYRLLGTALVAIGLTVAAAAVFLELAAAYVARLGASMKAKPPHTPPPK